MFSGAYVKFVTTTRPCAESTNDDVVGTMQSGSVDLVGSSPPQAVITPPANSTASTSSNPRRSIQILRIPLPREGDFFGRRQRRSQYTPATRTGDGIWRPGRDGGKGRTTKRWIGA